jgi:phosphoglycerate dehydrogenase-like enzyme
MPAVDLEMTCVLFPHRDADYFAPRLRERFPGLTILTAPDLSDAEDLLGEADVIMATGHLFNDRRLRLAGRLRWIHAMTTGFDSIVLSDALRPEVVLTTTRGIHGPQTSEMAIMYMLNLARGVPRMIGNQRKHVWQRWTQVRLYGKTVAILGMGVIAEALAPRCKALGMTVLGVTRTPRSPAGFDRVYRYDELRQAAALADFLVVLAPHARETENIIDAGVLAAMKKSAFLINLARGAVCDEAALLDALVNKRIAGAGLDVFRKEPLPGDSPFWDLDNVMISAHCSGSSDDNRALTWPIIETNMACFLEGRCLEMVNIVPH